MATHKSIPETPPPCPVKWKAGRAQANATVLGLGSRGVQSQEAEQKPQHHLRGTRHGGGVHSEMWRMTRLLPGWGVMGGAEPGVYCGPG